jgi:iron(III) transport system substrate-binding protein
MNNLKSIVAVAALFVLAQLISASGFARAQSDAGWQKKWDAAVAEAKKEGKVIVMGPPGDAVRQALTQGFTKAFPGIAIEYSGGRGGELSTKIKAERDAGIYSVDIIINGTSTANAYFKPMKALEPIEPQLILPEVADPKNWRDDRLEFSDRSTHFNLLLTTQNNVPVIFNSKLAKVEEVDELSDLLNPKWKGKIAVQDPIPSGSGNGVFRWLWEAIGPEKTMDFYKKIRAQAAVVDRDQRRQIEWVALSRWKRANRFASHPFASSNERTGPGWRKIPHIDPTADPIAGILACRKTSTSPATSRSP